MVLVGVLCILSLDLCKPMACIIELEGSRLVYNDWLGGDAAFNKIISFLNMLWEFT